MPRTERFWGRVTGRGIYWTECPLCGRDLVLEPLPEPYDKVLPGHLTEGLITCSGSNRTVGNAGELARLRMRAHP
jgi:hypothetical protein